MSMTLRFERADQGGSLNSSVLHEKDRILKDEQLAERVLQLKKEADVNLKAEWSESLEQASRVKRLKKNKVVEKSELSFANKCVVSVRRAALRALLEREHYAYEKELNASGRAFYVKRV